MKNNKINYLLCFIFFAVLAAVTFRCTWPSDHVFAASDLNIGRLAFSKHLLPEMFIGYYRSVELFGISSHGFSLFNILLATLPLVLFAKIFYGLMLMVGSMSMVWFLRMWNRSWTASVVGALIAFWVNSVMLAVGGHAYKIEVLAFSVLALGLIEKSVRVESIRKSVGFALLAGISVGIMMIEQQDVALLAGLFIGPYAIFRLVQVQGKAVLRWAVLLVPLGAVALLLAGSTMLKSYDQNIAKATSVQGEPEDKWNFITQWSLVPEEWPDLIASGWSGWSSNNPEGPYWGKLGQSAEWPESGQGFRNFKLTSNYIGIIPFLLGAFGLAVAIRNRKTEEGKSVLFWSIAGLIGFWLAFGKYSLLYKLFYHLPLMGSIRAPIKLLDNFQICLGMVAAYGLDRLVAEGKAVKISKVLWISSAAIAGLMALAGFKMLAFPTTQAAEFIKMGFEPFAKTMVSNMANAWFHGALLALACSWLGFVIWKGLKPARWVSLAFVAVLAADSLALTSNYFKSTDIESLKKGNVVVNYIKENQGNERTFFTDTSGLYNQWLASDGPYHGLNLFNVWQMSRMPPDYKKYFETVGRNQLLLWELASVKYIAAPATIMQQLSQNPALTDQFSPALHYQVPTAQGMRKDVLLEFKSSIPRFALFQGWKTVPLDGQCQTLVSPDHNVRSTLLLDPAFNLGSQTGTESFQPLDAKVTKRSATLSVQCASQSIVRFSQYFQPGWKAFVNGKPADLLQVDYICMGVAVPPGDHVVEFRCPSGVSKAAFALGTFLISIIAAAFLLLKNVRKDDA